MSFKEVSFIENDVIVCALKKRQGKKAIPTSAYLEDKHEEHKGHMNHINEERIPKEPAKFWIIRGYQVYSTLTDDGFWFQYCLSSKPKSEKLNDLDKYKKDFIPDIEPPMCFVKGCPAYMTFDDDCEHTANSHLVMYDYY